MTVGQILRRLLGVRLSRSVGQRYRAIFVDINAVVSCLNPFIPIGAKVLDVGGGDGGVLNALLTHRSDVEGVLIDVSASAGGWLNETIRTRVVAVPHTTLDEFIDSAGDWRPDVILVTDVIHHISPVMRLQFYAALGRALRWSPRVKILIKDVEPGHWRSHLGYWSDRYITGDTNVALISKKILVSSLRNAVADLNWGDTVLSNIDPPNYAVWFSL